MDFLVALFRNLLDHPDWTMNNAATEAYNSTLKKWHGWIASSAFTVSDEDGLFKHPYSGSMWLVFSTFAG